MNQSHQFAKEQFSKIRQMINAGLSMSVIGIPGCGISVFLKQLSAQPFGKMIHIDVFSLPSLTSQEFFANLYEQLGGKSSDKTVTELVHACQDRLTKTKGKDGQRVVIIISGFDKLAPDFSNDFFRYLRSLHSVNQSKIVFVFGICRRLET